MDDTDRLLDALTDAGDPRAAGLRRALDTPLPGQWEPGVGQHYVFLRLASVALPTWNRARAEWMYRHRRASAFLALAAALVTPESARA